MAKNEIRFHAGDRVLLRGEIYNVLAISERRGRTRRVLLSNPGHVEVINEKDLRWHQRPMMILDGHWLPVATVAMVLALRAVNAERRALRGIDIGEAGHG